VAVAVNDCRKGLTKTHPVRRIVGPAAIPAAKALQLAVLKDYTPMLSCSTLVLNILHVPGQSIGAGAFQTTKQAQSYLYRVHHSSLCFSH
jgi:hypothetical protein